MGWPRVRLKRSLDGLTSAAGRTQSAHCWSVGRAEPTGNVSNRAGRDGVDAVAAAPGVDGVETVAEGTESNVAGLVPEPLQPARDDGGHGGGQDEKPESSTCRGPRRHLDQRPERTRRVTRAATFGTT